MASFGANDSIANTLATPATTAAFVVGLHAVSDVDGNCYRYVKFVDAITYVSGQLCCLASATTWDVTNDRAGGAALAGHIPIGFVQGTVPTANQHGWVQCGGIVTDAIMGSAAVIAGDPLKPDATEDGDIDEATFGTHGNICAIAMATIADNGTGVVKVHIPAH